MKLNYKDPIYWLIILSVSFFLWGTCQKNKVLELKAESVKAQHKEQIQELDQQGQTKAARIAELESERTRMRDSAKVAVMSKKGQIKAHEKRTEELRPEIAARLDSVPVLKAFVASLESTITEQKSLIQTLELSHSAEIVNLEKQLKEKGDQVMIERVKGDVWRDAAVQYEKERNKLTRGKKFRNVLIGVLTAGIVYVSLKE